MYRGDIDGLPISEQQSEDLASANPGVHGEDTGPRYTPVGRRVHLGVLHQRRKRYGQISSNGSRVLFWVGTSRRLQGSANVALSQLRI